MTIGYILPDDHVLLELARYVSFELFIQTKGLLSSQTN